MDQTDNATIARLFECTITKQIFRDPVVAEDGYTYEREAIMKRLQTNGGTSPNTQQSLHIDRLFPNLLVKELIHEHFDIILRKKKYIFKLGEDIKKLDFLFEHFGKIIYEAEWIKKPNEQPTIRLPIILMSILGARAKKEAVFYVEMSKHAHIVRTYGLVVNPRNEVMLVQERAEHRSLKNFLRTRDQPISEEVLKEIFIQIADGMSFLAHNSIVHGDIACRNILVFKFDEQNPKQTLVKVTDFGLSQESSIYESVSTSAFTTLNMLPIRYAAPEILQNPKETKSYTEKSDMYSMGVLMWEAYFPGEERPWSHIDDDKDVKQRVVNGERLQQPLTCSKEMWSLIQTTMSQQPSGRPAFADLHRQLIELKICIQPPEVLSRIVKEALEAIRTKSTKITLSRSYLCDEDMKIIAQELKTNETVDCLDLRHNNLSNEGAIAIAEMLEVNKTVNEVLLNGNNISSEGAKRLAKVLLVNKTLTSLQIGRNPLSDDGIQAICEVLKTNKTLQKLWIHGTQLSIIGLKLIVEMLRTTTALTELAMGTNNIRDDGAKLIAEALKINTSLTWLYMESGDITDEGGFALAKGIEAHRKKIDYFFITPDPPMTDNGRNAIKAALRTNATFDLHNFRSM